MPPLEPEPPELELEEEPDEPEEPPDPLDPPEDELGMPPLDDDEDCCSTHPPTSNTETAPTSVVCIASESSRFNEECLRMATPYIRRLRALIGLAAGARRLCDRGAERWLTCVATSFRWLVEEWVPSERGSDAMTVYFALALATGSPSPPPIRNNLSCPASRSHAVLCTGAIRGMGAIAPIITEVPFTPVVTVPAFTPSRTSQIVAS